MQKKHFLFILAGLAVVVVVVCLVWLPASPGKVDGRKLVVAAHAYSAQLRASGAPFPEAVSLDELIAKGYLKHEDVSGFDGMKVAVFLVARADQPSVLVQAKLPDGHEVLVLTDGSVQTH